MNGAIDFFSTVASDVTFVAIHAQQLTFFEVISWVGPAGVSAQCEQLGSLGFAATFAGASQAAEDEQSNAQTPVITALDITTAEITTENIRATFLIPYVLTKHYAIRIGSATVINLGDTSNMRCAFP